MWPFLRSQLRPPLGRGSPSGQPAFRIAGVGKILLRNEINLQFVGGPPDRLQVALDRRVPAARVLGTPSYALEQLGFQELVDTTFIMGFWINREPSEEQVWAHINAPQRAQRVSDAAKEPYQRYFLRERATPVSREVRPPQGRHGKAPGFRALCPGCIRTPPPPDARPADFPRFTG